MARKKLSVEHIKKENEMLVKQKTIVVKDYNVKVDTVFRKTEANKMVAEMWQKLQEANQNNYVVSANVLYYILLIKYFTNINIPDELSEQINILNMMIDNDMIEPILEAFPGDELIKVSESLNNLNRYVESLSNQNVQLDFDVVKDAIENGDIDKQE